MDQTYLNPNSYTPTLNRPIFVVPEEPINGILTEESVAERAAGRTRAAICM